MCLNFRPLTCQWDLPVTKWELSHVGTTSTRGDTGLKRLFKWKEKDRPLILKVIYFGHFWSKNKSETLKIPEVNWLFITLYIQLDDFAWWIFAIARSIVGNYIAFWVDFNSGQRHGCQARRIHWERVFTSFIDYNERSTIAHVCVHPPYIIAPW